MRQRIHHQLTIVLLGVLGVLLGAKDVLEGHLGELAVAQELKLYLAGVEGQAARDVVDVLVARELPLVRGARVVVPAEAPRLPR